MDLDDYIEWRIKWFFLSRFLFGCIAMFIGMIVGVCFVIHWIYRELTLEASYQQKYGTGWQAEFEKYHGSLTHAHTQLVVSVSCMLALIAVLTWFCRQTFRRHKRHIRENHDA